MIHTVVILSGASGGIGAHTALAFLSAGHYVLNISRRPNTDLEAQAPKHQAVFINHCADLSRCDAEALRPAFEQLPKDAKRYILINNAGGVEPIANTANIDEHLAEQAFTLNCVAPMMLTRLFMETTQSSCADKRIVNISSGAGRRAIPGWGVYCATKSALDMYSQVFAIEHPEVRIVSLAPGIVDTKMQQTIRSASPTSFPDLEKFKEYKRQGQLNDPAYVGRKIRAYIEDESFGTETLMDIRHFNFE